jgi:phospholipid N-methyltransferase
MVAGDELMSAETVVELGPGTGSFTRAILRAMDAEATFLALELDDRAVRRLRQEFPGVHVYHDSAEAIQRYLSQHSKRWADYVVSGLPWALMEAEVQGRIMEKVASSLSDRGVFVTFTYLVSRSTSKGRQYARVLDRLFDEVAVSSRVWRNFPPAMVYRCRGPSC